MEVHKKSLVSLNDLKNRIKLGISNFMLVIQTNGGYFSNIIFAPNMIRKILQTTNLKVFEVIKRVMGISPIEGRD